MAMVPSYCLEVTQKDFWLLLKALSFLQISSPDDQDAVGELADVLTKQIGLSPSEPLEGLSSVI